MAVNPTELEALRTDYLAARGTSFQQFMCPITLRDEPCELMDGHILNAAFKTARRTTVIQRKDVDNYFGSTIEPDLINRLNGESACKEEWFQQAKHLFVTGPDGQRLTLLHPRKVKAGVFPKLDLMNDDGSIWASGYLKADPDRLQGADQLLVGHRYPARNGAILGSWMKVGYLTMFKLFGYRYVYTGAAEHLRSPLSNFVMTQQSNADADRAFGQFAGACGSINGPMAADLRETLTDGVVLVRVAEQSVFAISLLFRVNGTMHTVTVPLGGTAAGHYQRLMDDPTYRHELRAGVVDGRDVRVEAQAFDLPAIASLIVPRLQ